MCTAFNPDCRCDNSNIKLFGSVYRPTTMCSGTLCEHKKTSQSLNRSVYECPQFESLRNIPFEGQKNGFC